MTAAERMNLKAMLETKRAELQAELYGQIPELAIDDRQPDPLDSVQRMYDRNAAATRVDRLSLTLAEVTRSLRQINEDLYGNCGRCERPIGVKRLRVIPWAAYCVRCQERIEAEGSDFNESQAA